MYETFRDACYTLGYLDDDKEYIDAFEEASVWGSADYLRRMFVLLLHSNSMSRPSFVWSKCWKSLADDILYKQRLLLNNPGKCLFLLFFNSIFSTISCLLRFFNFFHISRALHYNFILQYWICLRNKSRTSLCLRLILC